MSVARLVLTDFRNIQAGELLPSAHLNFIYGANGSGKTSILEALSTIALGRSFRSRKYKNIIRYDQNILSLFCDYVLNDTAHRIGVSRSRSGESVFKLDGRQLTSSFELANLVPLQVINASSFELLSGSPSERRGFLDWLVFHVKHSFQSDWRQYMQCLKQRNNLLRSDTIDTDSLSVWDEQLASYADAIDLARSDTVKNFLSSLMAFCTELDFIEPQKLSLEYLRGWSVDYESYRECLKASFSRDYKLGYTSHGAHKSDIRIRYNSCPVAEIFSRGQLKSLSLAMYMAQVDLFLGLCKKSCLLLIDDLPAELDQTNIARMAKWLDSLNETQIFLTAVELEPFISLWPKNTIDKSKLFHVKHGKITEHSMHTES